MTDSVQLKPQIEEKIKDLRTFLEIVERASGEENGADSVPFRLPYATRPTAPLRQWKMTFGA